jgi:hypothetical protein
MLSPKAAIGHAGTVRAVSAPPEARMRAHTLSLWIIAIAAFLAGAGTFVACGGSATTGIGSDADGGTTEGDSGPPKDAGCALYGQICTSSGQCCLGVPCTGGRCEEPIK